MTTIANIVYRISKNRNDDYSWKQLGSALESTQYYLARTCFMITQSLMLKNLLPKPNMLYACIIPDGDIPEKLDGLEEWIAIHNGKLRTRRVTAREIRESVRDTIKGLRKGIIDISVRCSHNYGAKGVGVCGGVLELAGYGWIVVLFGGKVDADKSCGLWPNLPIGSRSSIVFKEDMVHEFVNGCLSQLTTTPWNRVFWIRECNNY